MTHETYGIADVYVDVVAEIFQNFVEIASSSSAQECRTTVRLTTNKYTVPQLLRINDKHLRLLVVKKLKAWINN